MGEPELCSGGCAVLRRVIDPVTDHCHGVIFVGEAADDSFFIGGHDFRPDVIDPQFAGNGIGSPPVVAGKQDRMDLHLLEGLNGISNSATEDLNSKIEVIKRSACGYRNKDNFRTAILFHCGKLNLMPEMGR